ncbi:hypothetical protein ACLMJK_001206 [Lecanora helva]
MTREVEQSGSKQGLLTREHGSPASPDDSHGSGSEADADELDFLDADTTSPTLRGGWSPKKKKGKGPQEASPRPKLNRKGGWLRNRVLWLLAAVLLGVTVGVIGGLYGGIFKKPGLQDGLSPPWYESPKGGILASWEESYKKAAMLVSKMTLPEKVNVTTGTGWAQDLCVGNTAEASIVGFPPLCLQDGPLGIRFADHATAWPAGITVGATWNKALMYRRGRGLGLEHRLKGVNVLLGPCMGAFGRMPGGGRTWEGFGPDPVLQGIASAQTIKGIQEEGVMATAKHFIANEQEHFRQENEWRGTRYAISSNIDDRTLHEMYLWPFADSVRAGVASIMCSYNMVNNSYACGNSKLMNGILKDELGFQGFIQSDWLAQRSGVASALAGLDMTMPGDGRYWKDANSFFGPELTRAVLNASVPIARMNDMATRVVAAWYQLGQDNQTKWPAPPPKGKGGPNFSSFTDEKIGKIHPESDDSTTAEVNKYVDVQGKGDKFHGRLAQEIAAEGTVLVKNEGSILPLSPQGANKAPGSPKYRVGIFGEDAGANPDGPNACEDRACNVGTLASGWGSGAVLFPFLVPPLDALNSTFDSDKVVVNAFLTNVLPTDPIFRRQDLCIVFINSDAGEGFQQWKGITDRQDLHPQKGGDKLVKDVADHCAQTIVVVHAVGPVILEEWIDHPNVQAVLLANLPGEASGNALADVLFGRVDASGRLPYTVGKSLADYGPGGQILFRPHTVVPQQDFKEGLYVDYRHFDNQSITPRYEFGYGLSYTTWTFSNLDLRELKPKSPLPSPRPTPSVQPPTYQTTIPDLSEALFPQDFRRLQGRIYPYLTNASVGTGYYPYPAGYSTPAPLSQAGGGEGGNPSLYDEHLLVSANLTNSGDRSGKEVVQVYVSFPNDVVDGSTGKRVDFPVRVLRGFEKVEVGQGATVPVLVRLTRKDLSYWSVGMQNWVMPDGPITISVGASSRDLPLNATW